MNVLGISAHFHDSAAALIQDGRLVAAAAEERFSRIRHDSGFPRHAVQFCLRRAGISAHDLDRVVFYEEPHQKFTRVLASTLGAFPRSLGPFVGAMKGWLSHKLFVRGGISKELDVHPDVVELVPHHLSHAAYAFESSGLDEAAILIVDAVGEWSCTTLARGRRGQPIEVLETVDYPNSIGLFYAAMTAFFGFQPNSDECTTMALAAFGRPTRVEDLRAVLRLEKDGAYSLDPSWFDFLRTDGRLFTARFRSRFGEPAPAGTFDGLDAMADPAPLAPNVQAYADLAASVQALLEEAVLGLARRLHARTGSNALCFAGGVALNCVANRRLALEGPFSTLHIPVDPGDGGGAIGAALLVANANAPIVGISTPYLGDDAGGDLLGEMMPHLDSDVWKRVGLGAATTRNPRAVRHLRHSNADALADDVVHRLREGQIVGWMKGRFEFGPRALGARSLLLDPKRVDRARDLSRTVKRRAALRPYSLACAAEDAARLLPSEPAGASHRWMQVSARVADGLTQGLRAAVHVDGTTRPQVCSTTEHPEFNQLLRQYGVAIGGPAALLNTSLNERGAPICASAVEGLAMFARTDMDALVADDHLFWKEW